MPATPKKPPITTHQWLGPLYQYLGATGPSAYLRYLAAGAPTAFGGFSGLNQFTGATGGGLPNGTGVGVFQGTVFSGGTGTSLYTINDVVAQLKRLGILPT